MSPLFETLTSQRSWVIAALLLGTLVSFSSVSYVWPRHAHMNDDPRGINNRSRVGESSDDPQLLLSEADHFYWLNNGHKAAPLYARAEGLFSAHGDLRKEVHAKVGRLRSEAETMSFVELSRFLEAQLHDPVVERDKGLRLWCLIAKG